MESQCTDSFHEAKKAYSRCALITLAALSLIHGLSFLTSFLIRDISISNTSLDKQKIRFSQKNLNEG